jgi:hypothetical protein
MGDLLKLGGLWKAEKEGKTYLSGNLGPGVRILIFPNKFKKEASHPDYTIFLAQTEPKGQGQDRGQSQDPSRATPRDNDPIPW